MATKANSRIMWITMTEPEVKRVFFKAAWLRNRDIQIKTFIPACLWERFVELESICKEERRKDVHLRTQIRVGKKDLELLTKYKEDPQWCLRSTTYFGPLPCVGASQTKQASPPRERIIMIGSNHHKRKDVSPIQNVNKKNRTEDEDDDTIDDAINQAADFHLATASPVNKPSSPDATSEDTFTPNTQAVIPGSPAASRV